MGLLLSVLITCVGVIEAVTCYHRLVKGMIPEHQPGFDDLMRRYDEMFTKALALPSPRGEEWKRGGQGYLHLEGPRGALKASIKFAGGDQDTTSLLFSTKISSFGQESIENENPRANESPERYNEYENKEEVTETFYPENDRSIRKTSPVSNFWDDDPEIAETETASPPKEKIQWHYRPLTPTASAELPAIHFDSYERKTGETEDQSGYSDEFLRSLDGVKFRPLQRDDGTGRRRSFKKRHSSSSNSSRDSRASREEELKIFTSLEEDEFERVREIERSSAPNLSADYNTKRRSRTRSKDRKSRSPAQSLSSDLPEEQQGRKSPTPERPLLKNLPKVSSFEELPNEEESKDFALSQLTSDSTENNEEEDSGVSFWDT